ncbi:hypothetical protein [Actibacterium sp.]|uniref:hypothetical protein n=1 Tax=Actibacterium sp. TaxID=1872125 RepID=UPI00257E130B|nr:hypothetical protein [Actibacterium sp.]
MADKNQDAPIKLGIYGKKRVPEGWSAADIIAASLSLLWLAGAGLFFLFAGSPDANPRFDPIVFVLILIAVTMPVALFWVGASAAKSARIMREESTRLQSAIDAMRHTYIQQQQMANMSVRPTVEKKLDQLVAAQKQAESAMATFASVRSRQAGPPPAAPQGAPADDAQPSLALGTPAEEMQPPLSVEDFIRALNFPETADDQEGFRALRRALQDRTAAKLVRSAQDVLTLLSQDGIYMDDLNPDRSRPELWRRFAQGERGAAIAALGGVRDRSCLALTSGRMRQDPIFRDAAHHFLRQFDHTFSAFEKTASDQEINDLSETRTARAFMLLGRVSGTFD